MIGTVNSPGVSKRQLEAVEAIAESAKTTATSALSITGSANTTASSALTTAKSAQTTANEAKETAESLAESLEDKANQSVSVSATLSSGDWSSGSPYTQTVSVAGLSADSNGMVGIAQGATESQRVAAQNACLSVASQAEESLTIVADGTLPTVDIPITIVIIG